MWDLKEQGKEVTSPLFILRWCLPIEGFYKMNVDGSFFPSNKRIGSRGVVRDLNYTRMVGLSSLDEVGDIDMSEILAWNHDLNLAWDKGFRKVLCEMDNLNLVHILNSKEGFETHLHVTLLLEAREKIQRDWKIEVNHVDKEANGVAHFLAGRGVCQEQPLCIWEIPSS